MGRREDDDVIIELPTVLAPERARRFIETVALIYARRALFPGPIADTRR